MSQAAIEFLLRKKTGLDPASIGSGTIVRSVKRRMANCCITDIEKYLDLLQKSEEELEELLEFVIVPETWFFRDKEPFVYLRNFVRLQRPSGIKKKKLRVLCAPCSTGEEPYSISISLIEAGLSTSEFTIDAVDISRKALQKAEKGVYGKNSFRYKDIDFQKRYLEQTGNEFTVIPLVKSTVNFNHCNMTEKSFFIGKEPYDIIFCRNLLIYLDRSSRIHLINALDKLLNTEGLLFLGHAETLRNTTSSYQLIPHPRAFGYKKIDNRSSQNQTFQNKSADISAKKTMAQKLLRSHEKINNNSGLRKNDFATQELEQMGKEKSIAEKKDPSLDKAQELADKGSLEEAALICEKYLNENGPDAAAYYLLGLIQASKGNVELAENYFSKSFYLEPDNYEVLIHLALLLEKRGEARKAMSLRQRAERVYNSKERYPAGERKGIPKTVQEVSKQLKNTNGHPCVDTARSGF